VQRLQNLQPLSEAPVASSIPLADQIAVGVAVAAVVVATVSAVSAVSGGAGCCGSYCCRPDCCSAIRIPPTISGATISGAAIGHATPRNGTAADTDRARPSGVNTCTAATVGECVVGNKGRAEKYGGCQANESITQHW
jgi:hypothetical protein